MCLFLSTPSARRATQDHAEDVAGDGISIHALREEGDGSRRCRCCRSRPISIHALREEGDAAAVASLRMVTVFLSTPSARRATPLCQTEPLLLRISIHALREEGDRFCWRPGGGPWHFYPRPPRGGRLDVLLRAAAHSSISIHALREEGDVSATSGEQTRSISIHALREEGDSSMWWISFRQLHFYPRPPRGGRPPGRHHLPKW